MTCVSSDLDRAAPIAARCAEHPRRAEIALNRPFLQPLFSNEGGESADVSAPEARVVVVEDEAAVREAVVAGLRQEGFVARGYGDAVDADAILGFAPDLAILDVGLPSGSGFALARRLRDRSPLSIIFLTARDAVADRVEGLSSGPTTMSSSHSRSRSCWRAFAPCWPYGSAGDVLEAATCWSTRAGLGDSDRSPDPADSHRAAACWPFWYAIAVRRCPRMSC